MERGNKGFELKVGSFIYILQHQGCSGNVGKILEVDGKGLPIKTECTKCHREGVIPDYKLLYQAKLPPQQNI